MIRLFHILAAALVVWSLALAIRQARLPLQPAPEAQIVSVFAKAGFSLATQRRTLLGPELSFTRSDCAIPMRAVLTETIHRDAMQILAGMAGTDEEVITVYGGAAVPSLHLRDIAWPWLQRKLGVMLGLYRSNPWDSIGLAIFSPRKCRGGGPDWSSLLSES
ncbi:hypothetical protein C5L14_01140 [Labrys okinawensis]|uniref:Uncharacterized protein n=1 Tax=Labrys okinawensis TaxID=346911 RepID=A0A2S9QIN7_9HYPH|nr:hypothetical protein [Labrys okinawensis]PRH89229.1 hypothetical protein C5L14_01140 [Labrys okinawensis]